MMTPGLWLVFGKSASFSSRTLSSFPFALYTIGFASGFALHILRRMVVFPAFALPMMRIRNWGHSARMSSASKAPCLNGRASLDDLSSLFAADIAGEAEECTASLKTRWSEINLGVITIKSRCFLFWMKPGCSPSPSAFDQDVCKKKRLAIYPRHNLGTAHFIMIFGRPLVWTSSKEASVRQRPKFNANIEVQDLPPPHAQNALSKTLHSSLWIHGAFVTLCRKTIHHPPSSHCQHEPDHANATFFLYVFFLYIMLPNVHFWPSVLHSNRDTKLRANFHPPRPVTVWTLARLPK